MEKKETTLINRITHFTFQLCRKTKGLDHRLENQLNDIMFSLKGNLFISEDQEERNQYLQLLSYLFKLIAYTRDIYDGKGERDLTYMMIIVWYKHFPKLAVYIIEKICSSSNPTTNTTTKIGFGSWKDAKYICQYIKHNSNILAEEKKEKCIEQIIQIMNRQLYIDFTNQTENNLSLIAKWIPREKSKFGWLYESLVQNWNANYEKQKQASNHSYKKYRKILTSLNTQIDTTQIKQCERKSDEINYYNVTHVTKNKNADYFLRNSTKYITNSQTYSQTYSQKSPHNYDLGEISRERNIEQKGYMDIWKKTRENILSTSKTNDEIYLLPILDMTSNNIEEGIAISILLSEISSLSNRIMTYDHERSNWISLDPNTSLYEKKMQIRNQTIRPSTSYKSNKTDNHSILAIESILKSILETKLPLEKIENMYLVFISDFTFNLLENKETKENKNHYSLIKHMFQTITKTTKIPKIIYWNISTEIVPILPCSATTPNVIFLAGTASSNFHHLIHFFTTEETNPFSYYNKILNQEKYQPLETYLYQQII